MKIYKPFLALSFIVGSLGVAGCSLHAQQEFEKFVCQVGIARPVVTVFTSNLKKLIPRK